MALRDFVIDLMENLLSDEELALTEQNLRFYDKGTTAETDQALDDHIRWRNARYFNEDSNVIRSSILIVQLPMGNSAEYINFHVGELYRIYRTDGMDKLLPIVKKDIMSIKATAGSSLALLNQFGNYEAVRDHLIIRPLNYDDKAKALVNAVYRQLGDIALVLYISLGSIDQDGTSNILSAMVPKKTFQGWALDEDEVFNRALENTMRLQPPVFLTLDSGFDLNTPMTHVPFMDNESISFDFDSPLAPTISTEQEVNGAIAMFYPGVLERLYRMVGGDFYVVFTGTSDVHIHPVNGKFKVSKLRSTLADTNREMNLPEDILSRQIYQYSGEQKQLTVV